MTAVVTTYLEMTDRAKLQAKLLTDLQFRVLEATIPQWRLNRFLYELVGAAWSWRDKLTWTEAQWKSYVERENLRTFVASYGGALAGYFELLAQDMDVEIACFGLAPEFIGRGFGGPLLSRAIEEAWSIGPRRVWVHTCTLDHPAALVNYQARGMAIYKQETKGAEPASGGNR